jgi:hypothetical protein
MPGALRRRERERHVISGCQPSHRRSAVREWAQLPLPVAPEKPAAVPRAWSNAKYTRISRGVRQTETQTAMHRTRRTRHLSTCRHHQRGAASAATQPRGELDRVVEERTGTAFHVRGTHDHVGTVFGGTDDRERQRPDVLGGFRDAIKARRSVGCHAAELAAVGHLRVHGPGEQHGRMRLGTRCRSNADQHLGI